MQKVPELLIPLNNWKTLSPELNVLKNCDAVYFGLQSNFSMRARAGNFSTVDLPELVKKVHEFKKKIYLCTNIVVYDEELKSLEKIIDLAKKTEINAIICHDPAAIMISREKNIPEIHISTQANISNLKSVKFYQSMGASRVILSRELNLDQIKNIVNHSNIPVETFIHGAMCTSISGRCYFSSELMNFDQNFSANRGKCVQPCRRYYKFLGEEGEEIEFHPNTGMFFNAKDLCMIDHIDDLIESGISTFKVEGRMRDPLYISTVAACYREAIDSYFDNTYSAIKIDGWIKRLKTVFNRGFHTGFYYSNPNSEEIERTVRGNVSKWKKTFVGKVINYYKQASAVEIELFAGQIKLGQNLIFENKSDFFFKQKAGSIKIDDDSIDETPIASSGNHVIIGIKVEKKIPINSNVYIHSENRSTV